MANDALVPRRPDRGFSLVEMLVVVAIVAIMAAVAFPNIAGYTPQLPDQAGRRRRWPASCRRPAARRS